MNDSSEKNNFRVAVMIDLTWNFKRHTDVFAGIARYAHEHAGWQCVIDDFATDTLRRSSLSERPFDGVIGRVTPELQQLAARHALPLVNVWQSSPAEGVMRVYSDHGLGGEMLADHLLARGIRRFLCFIRKGDLGEKATARHFERVVNEHGGTCETIRVPRFFAHSPSRWRKTRSLVENWLQAQPPPVGIVAGIDIMGRYVAQICDELGLSVPRDVAIAGGYNEPSICLYPEPTLTSIEYGLDHVGYEAARMMHGLLLGRTPKETTVYVPPVELIVRQSSDFVYVEEEVVSVAMQFIAKNATRRIGVDDVSVAAGTSRRTLELRFEKYLGRSVAAEIRRVRLDQAKRLLASSNESIVTIARQTGIGSPQQFARVFRREVGLTPRAYRKQFQG